MPPLFQLIQQRGRLASAEMFQVFNMGIGMVAVVAPAELVELQASIAEETFVIGELAQGEPGVTLA